MIVRTILPAQCSTWSISPLQRSAARGCCGLKAHSSQKTNAARASHPDRIVIADVSDCRLPPGTEVIWHSNSEERRARCQLRLSPQVFNSAFPSCLGGGFWRRPQCLGSGPLDMNRKSPGDSPSRESPATLNSGPAALGKHSRALARNTLPEGMYERNIKVLLPCANRVERRNFLWKGKEKTVLSDQFSVPGRPC